MIRINKFHYLNRVEEKTLENKDPKLYKQLKDAIEKYEKVVEDVEDWQLNNIKTMIKEYEDIREIRGYIEVSWANMFDEILYFIKASAQINNLKELEKAINDIHDFDELEYELSKDEDLEEETEKEKRIWLTFWNRLEKNFYKLNNEFLLDLFKTCIDVKSRYEAWLPGNYIKKDLRKENINNKEYKSYKNKHIEDLEEAKKMIENNKINEEFWKLFKKVFNKLWV